MSLISFLFWQPKGNFYERIDHIKYKRFLILFFNYFLWIFLFFVSYLMIKKDIQYFWKLLFASLVTELMEKFIKSKKMWLRPLFYKKIPIGKNLFQCNYNKGSFPSGHTAKVTYFFLMLWIVQVINPFLFIIICIPLLVFRIFFHFHFPIDLAGGLLVGVVGWIISKDVVIISPLTSLVRNIFNIVFFIN